MKNRIIFVTVGLVVAAIMIYPFLISGFTPLHTRADAIVMVAGQYEEKIDTVAKLFHNGVAPLILLPSDGVKSRWSREHQRNLYTVEWTEEALAAKGVPRAAIVKLEFSKSGTIYDAVAVRDYVLRNNIHNLAVVTFDFHARRTFWSFRSIFSGHSVDLQLFPIATEHSGLLRRMSESAKLGLYMIRFGLMPPRAPMMAKVEQKLPANLVGKSTVLATNHGAVEIFPPDNPWNRDISHYPVHPNSASFIANMMSDKPLHPDFGSVWEGGPIGIPFAIVGKDQKKVPVSFQYAGESDPGPYPIPLDAPIEGGANGKGDRHVIVIDAEGKKLYELFDARRSGEGWRAGSGAVFDLTSNALRPAGWTSADAAGLPIFPGLVRYDEAVTQKEIRHALRFTMTQTQKAYIEPARHHASLHRNKNLPPLGLRVRLKKDYDVSGFPPNVQVILQALKKYGMILADNGGDWFLSGVHDMRWNNDELGTMKRVKGADFEVVYTGEKEF